MLRSVRLDTIHAIKRAMMQELLAGNPRVVSPNPSYA